MAESNSEVELVSCVDGEEWFSNAPDLYQFHAGELRQHKQAILGQFDDDIDHKNIYDTVPDPGVIHALINTDNTWKQRSPTVVTVLRNGQYLARVFNIDYRDSTVEFIVLDCNKPGSIVYSFNWSLGAYWSNFGYGNRGGCCVTAGLIKFLIRTSPQRDYVMIVGPSEDNIMPGVKLLHYTENMWDVKNMSFEDESEGLQRCWPVNIMFDPRPEYNGHVYLSLSTEKTWIYTRYVYRYDTKNLDAICKYDVHKDKPIIYRFPDKSISRNCFDLLNNGKYLILIQQSNGDSERLDVLIVDTGNLETKVRITIDRLGSDQGIDGMDRCLTIPFISLCKNYFAMLFWMKQWRATMPTWTVATFKVHGLLTHVLTLKQLARISILRSTKISNTFYLPLPETLKDYLVN